MEPLDGNTSQSKGRLVKELSIKDFLNEGVMWRAGHMKIWIQKLKEPLASLIK
jgi:hypothetical protein